MSDKFTKAEMLARSAKRFPWTYEEAQSILQAYTVASVKLSDLGETIGALADDDSLDPDGLAKRYKRRMLQNVGECMGELIDIVEPIYAKFPDLAPDDVRNYYRA